ncbi:MAG: sugar kinase [Rhodospirillales bacterium]|jgi:2-dehydro-3-deoxygluconokinase|nr:sugar kinase [Rhodospirillales bacterium]
MPEFVTLGEACVAFIAEEAGLMRRCRRFIKRLGGSETNVAVGVSRLGHSAGWISRVGADEFGAFSLMEMRAEKVDVSQVGADEDRPTGVFFQDQQPEGRNSVFFYRGGSAASGMTPDDVDEDYIAQARILLISGITPGLSENCRRTVETAFDIAKRHGVAVVFDTNIRLKLWTAAEARTALEPMMREADYLLAGRDDLTKLLGEGTHDDFLDYLHGLGPTDVVLKWGKEGAWLSSGTDRKLVPGYPTDDPVERVGAGDAFAAGFIVSVLRGQSIDAAVRMGNAVAGFAVRLPGFFECMPTPEALDAFCDGNATVNR